MESTRGKTAIQFLCIYSVLRWQRKFNNAPVKASSFAGQKRNGKNDLRFIFYDNINVRSRKIYCAIVLILLKLTSATYSWHAGEISRATRLLDVKNAFCSFASSARAKMCRETRAGPNDAFTGHRRGVRPHGRCKRLSRRENVYPTNPRDLERCHSLYIRELQRQAARVFRSSARCRRTIAIYTQIALHDPEQARILYFTYARASLARATFKAAAQWNVRTRICIVLCIEKSVSM